MKTAFTKIGAVLCIIANLTSCKKDNTSPDSSTPPLLPVKTEKGAALGSAVTRTIGVAGGTLTSGDGKLMITVPAGTVSANTVFSIQPITCTLQGKEGQPAYRLLPEGTGFAKRIAITYKYDSADISGSLEDLLTVSYQTQEGNWKVSAASVNKSNHTLTFTTDHFSDWSILTLLELKPKEPIVALYGQVDFEIKGFYLTLDDLLGPVEPSADYSGTIKWIGNWKVIGKGNGHLAPKTDTPMLATYKPPSPLIHGTMDTVQVELRGNIIIPDSSAPGGKRSFGQMILLSQIQQVNETFVLGKFDGHEIEAFDAQITGNSGQVILNANSTNDTSSMHYSIQVMGAGGAGSYPCGSLFTPGTAEVNVIGEINQQPMVYTSSYIYCGPPVSTKYSESKVAIDSWGPIGTFISGSFSGKLYKVPDNCSPPGKTLTIKFRAKRVY